jgi:hypothetical protein
MAPTGLRCHSRHIRRRDSHRRASQLNALLVEELGAEAMKSEGCFCSEL